MTIRRADVSDVARLALLAAQTYRDAFAHTFTAEQLDQRLRSTRSEAYFAHAMTRDIVLLAEEGAEMVGYAQFGPAGEDVQAMPGDMRLERLYVRKDFQRRGIGRALMHTAFAYPEMCGAQRVYLTVWEKSHDAIRLYESFGFVITDRADSEGDTIMVRDTAK